MPNSDTSQSGLSRIVSSTLFPRRRERGQRAIFLLVLLVGILLSWLIADLVAKSRWEDDRIDFVREANQIESKLQTEFNLTLEYLRSIPPLFHASEDVSRAEFKHFVEEALKRHPSIYAFAYLPKVPADQRDEFEATARSEKGFESYSIRSADPSDPPSGQMGTEDAFPIFYSEHLGEPTGTPVLGIDLATHPEQGVYVQMARSSEKAVATHPLSLIEDDENVLSVIAFAPIRDLSHQAPSDCNGLAVLILRVEPVVTNALHEFPKENFQIRLVDRDAGDGGKVVYENSESPATGRLPGWLPVMGDISFANQTWELSIAPSASSKLSGAHLSYPILLAGLGLSLLAAYSLSATVAIVGLRKQVGEAIELGRYRLGKKLGQGGMGVVYEAEHRMLARPAAIKLIQLDAAEGESESSASVKQAVRLNRFRQEAKATARLESPHTISLYDFGQTEDGIFYYVMERLRGADLSTLVKRFGPLPTARTIHLLRQACLSLDEAHQAGLIHRDIKPANVFACHYAMEYDFVKVLDFGLVKSETQESSVEITRPGTLIGTPAFIAPEMLLGETVDGRTDLYALGCVAYWLLTGKPPFRGPTATSVMAKHMTQQPESLRSILGDSVPESLDRAVLQCLSKKREERPKSAFELEQLLAQSAMQLPWTQQQAKERWQVERVLWESEAEPITSSRG